MIDIKCGIYCIRCIPNRKCYVGSSYQILARWKQHRTKLRKGTHYSAYLQNAWNKYGEYAFTFKILEECPRKQLAEREQFWINKLQPKFNSVETVYPRLALPRAAVKNFDLRLPDSMHAALVEQAKLKGLSLHGEILYVLQDSIRRNRRKQKDDWNDFISG